MFKLNLNHVSFLLILVVVIFILSSNLITAPANTGNSHTEAESYFLDVGGSWIGISQFQAAFGDNPLTAEETFWNPVAPWEADQCRKKLSDEVWSSSNSGDGLSSPSSLLFDLTISLQAQARKLYEDNLYENSVGWYVQHYSQDVVYSLVLLDSTNKELDVPEDGTGPITSKKSDHVSGSAGFIAWEGNINYTQAKLKMVILKPDGSTNFTQEYVVDFEPVIDTLE